MNFRNNICHVLSGFTQIQKVNVQRCLGKHHLTEPRIGNVGNKSYKKNVMFGMLH